MLKKILVFITVTLSNDTGGILIKNNRLLSAVSMIHAYSTFAFHYILIRLLYKWREKIINILIPSLQQSILISYSIYWKAWSIAVCIQIIRYSKSNYLFLFINGMIMSVPQAVWITEFSELKNWLKTTQCIFYQFSTTLSLDPIFNGLPKLRSYSMTLVYAKCEVVNHKYRYKFSSLSIIYP